MYGRIDALYGQNPYIVAPNRFETDPYWPLISERRAVSVYGPLWQVLSWLIADLAGPAAPPALFALVYKGLGLATLLIGAALIWAILGRLAPAERARGAWLYAANPLCLLELAGAGHNDGLMIALVLLGVLFQLRGRTILALIGFGLAVLTKWIVLLLVPAYLVWAYAARGLRRRMTGDLLAAAAIVVALAGLLYGRHWAGRETLEAISGGPAATQLRYSLATWTAFHLTADKREARAEAEELLWQQGRSARELPQRMLDPTEQRVKLAFIGLFAAWALLLLPRARGPRELLGVWGWTLFAYVCLASVWFWPWYVVWVLALAALMPHSRFANAARLLSVTALMLYVARVAALPLDHDLIDLPLIIFLPPLCYVAASHLRRRGAAEMPAARFDPALPRY
jgi:hypothetical protein